MVNKEINKNWSQWSIILIHALHYSVITYNLSKWRGSLWHSVSVKRSVSDSATTHYHFPLSIRIVGIGLLFILWVWCRMLYLFKSFLCLTQGVCGALVIPSNGIHALARGALSILAQFSNAYNDAWRIWQFSSNRPHSLINFSIQSLLCQFHLGHRQFEP